MTSTVIRIGNSNGLIIPSRILKSLSLTEKDEVEIFECNGGIMIRKNGAGEKDTPFSSLDKWAADKGYEDCGSIDDVLKYVDSIRNDRINKEIAEW